MNQANINQVLIVGGGTAGWLTAAKLAKQLNSQDPTAVQVTLIESPDIPTVGVGEGTWPTMRKTLAELGISESEFVRHCNASFKQGTQFVNWKQAPENGKDNDYLHLFSSVVEASDFNLSPYWSLSEQQKNFADSISAQGALCRDKLAPKDLTLAEYQGAQNYAYHLDAAKFAELLKSHACNQLGVKHLSANITAVKQDQSGDIASVETDSAGELFADFFVDCTGFKCLLLGETLGIGFNNIQDKLLTDHAVTIQVPYQDENEPIASCTISTAHQAGWTWDIGLQNRRGTGYVYSSAHQSHDEAEATLRRYLGANTDHLSSRLIKMNCGYREKFWHKNCVAIGLSAGFIEPLEASAIFLIEASGNMLAELFPRQKSAMAHVADKFNRSFLFRWQKSIDFIKLHYYLSKRQEAFWLDNKKPETVPETLLNAIAHWQHHPISQYDFDNVYEPFPLDSYQYVLHGMEFSQALDHNRARYNKTMQAQYYFQRAAKLTEQLQKQLPSNRDLLNKLKQYSFQKI
ncbi:tryptophan 7-halogenase [Catenovulum sp. SM1970]|uniref:tryptophan halogenase family protein n=1 Tax=Marinifaba aquimaris TaxID=2741323 RepID=UPI00157282D3|nr:tryptophan halogenase family protein [Marinifaba aquimaris]NTS76740.1 tryptophan 7-halogenase [Marinifaba aquimaris]